MLVSRHHIILSSLLLTTTLISGEILNRGWWNHTVFYQIYPRSFMDSDSDGVGDLTGKRERKESGALDERRNTSHWICLSLPALYSPRLPPYNDFRDKHRRKWRCNSPARRNYTSFVKTKQFRKRGRNFHCHSGFTCDSFVTLYNTYNILW